MLDDAADRRVAGAAALGATVAWGMWRLGRPELVFGLSTDDHARILAAWAFRDADLAIADVWVPLPALVTGMALVAAPWMHVVPGIVNLAWSAVLVYAVGRLAALDGAGRVGVALAAGLLGGSAWFGWLANSALAEPPYLAGLALAALALARARTVVEAWPAALLAALAGACRYEAWAAVVILPALAWSLPGSRRHLAGQGAALSAFPLAWMGYHQVANGDALAFLHTAVAEVESLDAHATDALRITADIAAAVGLVGGLGVAALAFAPPSRGLSRGILLLLGVELATVAAQGLGATGVHNGPRHHVVLLVALAVATGSSLARLDARRRFLFAAVALAAHLAVELPRQPPAAHSPHMEEIARAAAELLAEPGDILVDVPDDERLAFEVLIGAPERVRFALDEEGAALATWRAALGRRRSHLSTAALLKRSNVIGVVTTSARPGEAAGGRIVAEAGGYVLVVRE